MMTDGSSWAAATLLLSMLSLSCVKSERSIESAADSRISDARTRAKVALDQLAAEWKRESALNQERYAKSVIYPVCEAKVPPGGVCGLISATFVKQIAIDRFMRDNCGAADQDPDCIERYFLKFLATLRNRYGDAIVDKIDGSGSFDDVELRALDAHNHGVLERYHERRAEIDARYHSLLEHVVGRFELELNEIQANKLDELRQSQQIRNYWLAVAEGMSAAGRALASQPNVVSNQSTQALRTSCVSDFDCGFGQICVKDYGSMGGRCAQAVNQYGTPTYQAPDSSSFRPGSGQCTTTGCPPGFTCEGGNCIR